MKSLLPSVLAITVAGVMPATAQPPYFHDTFESYETGSEPTNPGDGNPNDWQIVRVQSVENREAAIVETDTAAGQATQALWLYQDAPFSSNNSDIVARRSFPAVSEEEIEVSFKVRYNRNLSGPTAQTHQAFQLFENPTGPDRGIRLLAILGGEDGLRDNMDSTDPKPGFTIQVAGGAANRINIIPQILVGDWYEVTITTRPASQTYDISIVNLNSTDPEQSSSLSDIGYFTSTTSKLSRFSISRAWTWLVVDVHVDDLLIRTTDGIVISDFDSWKNEHFGSPNHANAADASDPDGDGVANIVEYGLGGDPLDSSRGVLPVADLVNERQGVSFFRRSGSEAGYVVEASADLASWDAIAELAPLAEEWTGTAVVTEGAAQDGLIPTEVQHSDPAGNRGFLRLRLAQP